MNVADQATNTAIIFDTITFPVQSFKEKPNRFRDLYVKEGLSVAQIAQRLDCAKSTVLRHLQLQNVVIDPLRYDQAHNYRLAYPPFGYALRKGQLFINRRELKICRLVIHMRDRHRKTFNQISKRLMKKGFKNRRGQVSWQHVTVANIYKRWRGKL